MRPRRCDGDLTGVADRFFGVPAEEFRGVGDLTACVGERLAVLEHDQLGELLVPLGHDLECPAEDLGAGARGSGRPGGQRRRGSVDRQRGVVPRAVGDAG